MTALRYHEPRSLDEALSLLAAAGHTALPVAGGTDVARALRDRLVEPAILLGLRAVPELQGLREVDGGVEIGALTTLRDAERSEAVRRVAPALAATLARVGAVRIRNQGTLGGNLAQGHPAYDPPTMLAALGATVRVAGPHGRREVPADGLLHGGLGHGELVVAVHVPAQPAGGRATYAKVLAADRNLPATLTLATCVVVEADGRCRRARLVAGALPAGRVRLASVERALVGQTLEPAVVDDVAHLAADDLDAANGAAGASAYQRRLAAVWTARSLRRLAGDAAADRAEGAT